MQRDEKSQSDGEDDQRNQEVTVGDDGDRFVEECHEFPGDQARSSAQPYRCGGNDVKKRRRIDLGWPPSNTGVGMRSNALRGDDARDALQIGSGLNVSKSICVEESLYGIGLVIPDFERNVSTGNERGIGGGNKLPIDG